MLSKLKLIDWFTLLMLLLAIVGIAAIHDVISWEKTCESSSDCELDEICMDDGGYLHIKTCKNLTGWWQ